MEKKLPAVGAEPVPSRAGPVAIQIARFAAGYGVSVGPGEGTWEALRRSGVAHPGLAFAAWAETVALGGLLTPIVANCPDVGTALAELERFHPLLERDRIMLTRWPHSASITMCSPDGGSAHPDTVDAFFAVLCRILHRLAGERALPSQVMLRRAAPARSVGYDGAFGAAVAFDQRADSCRFGADALRAPIELADPAVRLALVPHAELRISRQRAPWSAAVGELAAAGTFGLARVAGVLAVSRGSVVALTYTEPARLCPASRKT